MRFLLSLLAFFFIFAAPAMGFTDTNGQPVNVGINPHYTAMRGEIMGSGTMNIDVDFSNAPNGACLYAHLSQFACKCSNFKKSAAEVNKVSKGDISGQFPFTRGHAYKALNSGSGTTTLDMNHAQLADGCGMVLILAGAFDANSAGGERMTHPYGSTAAMFFKVTNGQIEQMAENKIMSPKCAAGFHANLDLAEAETESALDSESEAEVDEAETEDAEAEVDEAGDDETEAEVDDAEVDNAQAVNTHHRRHRRNRRVSVHVSVQ